ncbi:metal ABC transporter permease [Flaviflexus equikiangi]|uniref:metal ABC transporter permease n=1 Tax=Flaviflexus equikiangi TaxID=2758573 RepID=UPI001C713E0A|nr:metal ABC transporter permease [Flaviflexus equikiangi]
MIDILTEMWGNGLLRRALIVAAIVGLSAPVMGTYLVQRRLTLLGDGIGHMALTGVAAGWLAASATGAANQDEWAVPGAIVASVLGALIIEYLRDKGKASGDVALALLFYGGIAGGVLLIGLAGGTTNNLNAYLFGSISTVTAMDLWLSIGLAAVVLGVGIGLRPALFALCHDAEYATASGMPVRLLSVLISVTAALTVAVAMRVVGVLLVSALMVIPVATAQLVTRSFVMTMRMAMIIGVVVAEAGLIITYVYDMSPGAMIVALAVGLYAVLSIIRPLLVRSQNRDPHPTMDDELRGEECQTA